MENIKQRLINAGGTGMLLPETHARAFLDMFARQPLSSCGLAIAAGASPSYKTGNVVYAVANGKLFSAAAQTPAVQLTAGVAVPQNQYGVVLIGLDAGGNFSVYFAGAGAQLSSAPIPTFPWINPATDQPQVCVGAIVLAPTSGAFTGGTSALDTVGAATFLSFVGPTHPAALF